MQIALNLHINYPIILLLKVKVTPKSESKLYNYNKILKCTNRIAENLGKEKKEARLEPFDLPYDSCSGNPSYFLSPLIAGASNPCL